MSFTVLTDEEHQALLARVKELEDASEQAIHTIAEGELEAVDLRSELKDANTDRARLREALTRVAHELLPLAEIDRIARAALASTDASEWLRARERKVAERVREECAKICDRTARDESPSAPNDFDDLSESLRRLDLHALLKEETES